MSPLSISHRAYRYGGASRGAESSNRGLCKLVGVPFYFVNILVDGSCFPRCSLPCLLPLLGGLFGPPCPAPGFCRPPAGRNIRGPSCGVWPFLGGLAALPACPSTVSRSFAISRVFRVFAARLLVATFVALLAGSGRSWGALRPSLLALLLFRGRLLVPAFFRALYFVLITVAGYIRAV